MLFFRDNLLPSIPPIYFQRPRDAPLIPPPCSRECPSAGVFFFSLARDFFPPFVGIMSEGVGIFQITHGFFD